MEEVIISTNGRSTPDRGYSYLLYHKYDIIYEAATLISLWINPRNDVTNESIMNEIKQIAGEV